ncbi:hypothetical protein GN244_ATG19423 [Phytophthora infestans]|uniref:Uncharacterized protein n=1 Tax=Phytophthora infestans TaxID=4787 RepID=A0A833SUU7_PHYIN|nr:hypothetical protein GN244_ATG19423 [Phytophthora infestans]
MPGGGGGAAQTESKRPKHIIRSLHRCIRRNGLTHQVALNAQNRGVGVYDRATTGKEDNSMELKRCTRGGKTRIGRTDLV